MNGKMPITTEINILNHFDVTQILSETVKNYLIAFEKGIDTLECAKTCTIILKSAFFKH